jgi:radical SAM superfamily enzyme YgiQ (UPF0313 family)
MSLLAVGALLEGEFEYVIVDGNLVDDPLSAIANLVDGSGNRPILGLTVMPGPQLEESVPLCRNLKQRYPNLTIVWGGYFPTQHWDVCLRSGYVDFVVRGHGELVFLQLLRALQENDLDFQSTPILSTPILATPGLAFRDGSNKPVSNPLAPIPSPDRLPAWNLDRVPVELYLRKTFLGTRTLGYHSSYGCPFFCNFCAVVNMVNGKWLPQTAESVATAVHTYASRWRVDAVEFYDNNFFTNQNRVAEFADRIMDLNLSWWGEGRIDTLQMYSEQSWRKMRDSGLRMVFLGAESGSDETLKRMHKGGKMSTEKTLEMASLMRSWGIVPEFSFVLGNPPNPEEDTRKTIEFIRKVKRVNPDSEIVMYLYTPVPTSGELYEEAVAEGFSFPDTLEEWVSPQWLDFSQRRSSSMPWLKRSIRDQILDFERVVNAYYPTSTNTSLTREGKLLLRLLSAWRFHLGFYNFPVELRAIQRFLSYQRPETSGF